jgi:hypothetical protein
MGAPGRLNEAPKAPIIVTTFALASVFVSSEERL